MIITSVPPKRTIRKKECRMMKSMGMASSKKPEEDQKVTFKESRIENIKYDTICNNM